MSEPIKGFVGSGPDPQEVLQLSPAQEAHLQALQASLELAASSHYILGGSRHCPACMADNNPNNACCRVCGAPLHVYK